MTKTVALLTAFVLVSACAGVDPSDQPTSAIADDQVAGGADAAGLGAARVGQ